MKHSSVTNWLPVVVCARGECKRLYHCINLDQCLVILSGEQKIAVLLEIPNIFSCFSYLFYEANDFRFQPTCDHEVCLVCRMFPTVGKPLKVGYILKLSGNKVFFFHLFWFGVNHTLPARRPKRSYTRLRILSHRAWRQSCHPGRIQTDIPGHLLLSPGSPSTCRRQDRYDLTRDLDG